jgi:hypothetical protein
MAAALVIELQGPAWVSGADGSLSPLRAGMQTTLETRIVTGEGGRVVLQVDGVQQAVIIGASREFMLSAEVAHAEPHSPEFAVAPGGSFLAELAHVFDTPGDASHFFGLLSAVEAEIELDIAYPRAALAETVLYSQDDLTGAALYASQYDDTGEAAVAHLSDLHQGDTLDLRDLLPSTLTSDDIAQYLEVVPGTGDDAGRTVLQINTEGNLGASGSNATQTLVLDNVAFTLALHDQIIQDVINHGKTTLS